MKSTFGSRQSTTEIEVTPYCVETDITDAEGCWPGDQQRRQNLATVGVVTDSSSTLPFTADNTGNDDEKQNSN